VIVGDHFVFAQGLEGFLGFNIDAVVARLHSFRLAAQSLNQEQAIVAVSPVRKARTTQPRTPNAPEY
jgi:hypothetical protein